MRTSFSDVKAIRKRAKSRLNNLERIIQRSWVQKYKRPPSDPLWKDQSFSEHLTEFFEDRWRDRGQLMEELKQPDLSPTRRMNLMNELGKIEDLLQTKDDIDETTSMGDLLEDYWIWQEENGQDIDMGMTLQKLRKIGWSR